VDVMTLTATPIPRTLHMSLTGVRDLSTIDTPPEERLPVKTFVGDFDDALVRQAILREMDRNGQVYFVHNRVQGIEQMAARVGKIVPEARIAIAHGQMPEKELSAVMLAFAEGEYDVLVCTSIIESGLDIPNANTIIINRADMFGLAQLYQLRGRVGRSAVRAYAYLLVDKYKLLTEEARRRLEAIQEASDLGAGFRIAMRDLEIRGAGNILGTQQSGHIALVGYELYCQLLQQAVARLKQLPARTTIEVDVDLPVEAYLPRSYVPSMRQKIDLYRRLARASAEDDLRDFAAELRDRFGSPPPVAERLLDLAEVRVHAQRWLIESVRTEDHFVVFTYLSRPLIGQLAALSGGRLRVVDDRSAYLPLWQGLTEPDRILAEVKLLLQTR